MVVAEPGILHLCGWEKLFLFENGNMDFDYRGKGGSVKIFEVFICNFEAGCREILPIPGSV